MTLTTPLAGSGSCHSGRSDYFVIKPHTNLAPHTDKHCLTGASGRLTHFGLPSFEMLYNIRRDLLEPLLEPTTFSRAAQRLCDRARSLSSSSSVKFLDLIVELWHFVIT